MYRLDCDLYVSIYVQNCKQGVRIDDNDEILMQHGDTLADLALALLIS